MSRPLHINTPVFGKDNNGVQHEIAVGSVVELVDWVPDGLLVRLPDVEGTVHIPSDHWGMHFR